MKKIIFILLFFFSCQEDIKIQEIEYIKYNPLDNNKKWGVVLADYLKVYKNINQLKNNLTNLNKGLKVNIILKKKNIVRFKRKDDLILKINNDFIFFNEIFDKDDNYLGWVITYDNMNNFMIEKYKFKIQAENFSKVLTI